MTEVLLARYDTEHGAADAVLAIRRSPGEPPTWIDDLAIIERHPSGRYATHVAHASVSHGVAAGGIAGLLVGLWFPPVALATLLGIGAAAGGIRQAWRKDRRLDGLAVAEMAPSLEPGQSAVLYAGDGPTADAIAEAMAPDALDVARRHLDEPSEAALAEAAQAAAEVAEVADDADAPPDGGDG